MDFFGGFFYSGWRVTQEEYAIPIPVDHLHGGYIFNVIKYSFLFIQWVEGGMTTTVTIKIDPLVIHKNNN